jgi:hypothetical protein
VGLPAVSRRAFLAGGGAMAIAAACGGGGSSDGEESSGSVQALRVSSELYPTDAPQRFAFALSDGVEFSSGPPATIAFEAPNRRTTPPRSATLHDDGLPEGRGIYVTEPILDQEGVWYGNVDVEGVESELAFEVGPVSSPVRGDTAPAAPSPTRTDPLRVDPICTREPACPLHDVSLTDRIGTGEPVAVMFATPARCQTQYCGPVLDLLLDVIEEGRHRELTVVHVEIYRSLTGAALVPTVTEWRLDSEPWLFGLDGAGRVVDRLDGAFDRTEISALLDRLAA